MQTESFPAHPGYCAADCVLRLTITALRSDGAGGGYACSVTGGHCLPGALCDHRLREHQRKQERLHHAFG
jgi:hypothetical protein